MVSKYYLSGGAHMKKLTITGIVLVMMAAILPASLFANGATENVGPWGSGTQKTTLTGTYKIDDGHPVLAADGKTYDLMIPGFYRYSNNTVPEGSTVTVKGYSFQPGPRAYNTSADLHFRVETVSYNGKDYVIPEFEPRGMMSRGQAGPRAAAGQGPMGRQGNWGPGSNNRGSYGYGPRASR